LATSEIAIATSPVRLAPHRSIARPPGIITASSAKNANVVNSPITARLAP
jgi:hypothetical protein